MAQPVVKGIPPFCLLLFGTDSKYSSTDIQNRWRHIINELKQKNIEVLTVASDSDPKYNSVMVHHLNLGHKREVTSSFPEYFNASLDYMAHFPFQDPIHIATKGRNRIINKCLYFGNHQITVQHLKKIIRKYPKGRHNLTEAIISPSDRMNFDSVLKICDENVISLLMAEKNCEGTVLYLRMLSNVIKCFLDLRLSHLERVRLIWFSNFVLRIWRNYIKTSKRHNTEEHFVSDNFYKCVEINSHSLVYLLLRLKDIGVDSFFIPELIGSQQCESIFRQIRSFTSTYSTVTESSVLEIMQRMSKIELQNDIVHTKLKDYKFPRTALNGSSFYPCSPDVAQRNLPLPSAEDIFRQMDLAKLEAVEYAESLGLKVSSLCTTCELKIKEIGTKMLKKEVHKHPDEENDAVPEARNEDMGEMLQLFGNLNLKEYSEKVKDANITTESQYVRIRDTFNQSLVVKKYSLCHILSKTTSKVSSDRLRRVMSKRD